MYVSQNQQTKYALSKEMLKITLFKGCVKMSGFEILPFLSGSGNSPERLIPTQINDNSEIIKYLGSQNSQQKNVIYVLSFCLSF